MIRGALGVASAWLFTACGRPSPDRVVQACLAAAAAHRYERALAYCGPLLQQEYSNHLWLARVHRQMAKETRFVVEPPEMATATSALVRFELEVTLHNDPRTVRAPLQAELAWRDKWYIDQVRLLDAQGQVRGDVFEHLHEPFWW